MDQVKQKSKLPALLLGLATLLFLFHSMFSVLNRPIYEISTFTILDEYDNRNGNQLDMDEFKRHMSKFSNLVSSVSDEDRALFEEISSIPFETIENLANKASLNAIIDFTKATKLDQLNQTEGIDEIEKIEGFETYGKLVQLTGAGIEFLHFLRIFIIACAIFIAFFLLLGVLFRVKTLTILSMIFSLPFFVIFAGIINLVIFFVLCIVHMILLPKKVKNHKI